MSNSSVVVTFWFGSETQKDGQCCLHVFHVDQHGDEKFVSAALQKADRFGSPKPMVVNSRVENAVVGTRAEIGGRWQEVRLTVAEGELFKLYARRKQRWNSVMQQACVFIKPRFDAALRTVQMRTLQMADSRVQTVYVQGRFDILTPSEAIAENNVKMKPMFERLFLPSAVNSVLEMIESESQRSARTKITSKELVSSQGETVKVRVRQRVRNLDFNS